MKILGIDPGTATIGIGLIECNNQEIKLIKFGLIETPKVNGNGERLMQIFKDTQTLLKEYQPDIIAIERLFFYLNAKTAMSVAESMGVIKLAAEQEKKRIEIFPPLQIKLSITGNGRADKKQVKSAIRSLLKIRSPKKGKTHFDDSCDALAVAICCALKNYSELKTNISKIVLKSDQERR